MTNTWTYRDDLLLVLQTGPEITGYDVEATDGRIGSVDEHTMEAGAGYLVVDTGFWIFGKKRLVPTGVVREIDHEQQKVVIAMTKEQVRMAPDLDETRRAEDEWYRATSGDYYDPYAW